MKSAIPYTIGSLAAFWIFACTARVQAADAPSDSNATRLILLATQGGPRVNKDRTQPANLLIAKGTPYLIDAGNGVARQLALAHVPPAETMRAEDIRASGLVYEDGNVRVTGIENGHYHFATGTPGYGWQKSFAFRFQTPDRVIFYSGPVVVAKDLMEF